MAAHFAGLGALAILEYENLGSAVLSDNGRGNRRAFNGGLTDNGRVVVADEQHIRDFDFFVHILGETFNVNGATDFDAVLFSTGQTNNCVHGFLQFSLTAAALANLQKLARSVGKIG
jgi:hypothetical protein